VDQDFLPCCWCSSVMRSSYRARTSATRSVAVRSARVAAVAAAVRIGVDYDAVSA